MLVLSLTIICAASVLPVHIREVKEEVQGMLGISLLQFSKFIIAIFLNYEIAFRNLNVYRGRVTTIGSITQTGRDNGRKKF